MATPLLTTKLQVPAGSSDLISRPELLSIINDGKRDDDEKLRYDSSVAKPYEIKRRHALSLVAFVIVLLGILPQVWKVEVVSGIIRDTNGRPLAGTTVRFKTTEYSTITDDEGRFELTSFAPTFRLRVTAWKDGYYVGGGQMPFRGTPQLRSN